VAGGDSMTGALVDESEYLSGKAILLYWTHRYDREQQFWDEWVA